MDVEFMRFRNLINDAFEPQNINIWDELDSFKTTSDEIMWNGQIARLGHNQEAPVTQVPSQQSVLKPEIKIEMAVDPHYVTPMISGQGCETNTPPLSDDEDNSSRTRTILGEFLESMFGGDSKGDQNYDMFIKNEEYDISAIELLDKVYFKNELEDFKEAEAALEEEQRQQKIAMERMRACFAAESDHSYHKGNSTFTSHYGYGYGLLTPSDSGESAESVTSADSVISGDSGRSSPTELTELSFSSGSSSNSPNFFSSPFSKEEIDVVSYEDKSNAVKYFTALPTRPSSNDQKQLQRTIQKRFPKTLKTHMPVKRSSGTKTTPAPRRNVSKPPKQSTKATRNPRQYKKRFSYAQNSDNEQEPTEKRHLHNNMERQRRIGIRNLFLELKDEIPEINKKNKVAKVLILRSGAEYCKQLRKSSARLESTVSALKNQQMKLMARLSHLRRETAARR